MENNKSEEKILKVISSCITIEHWECAKKLIENSKDLDFSKIVNLAMVLGIKYGLIINKPINKKHRARVCKVATQA